MLHDSARVATAGRAIALLKFITVWLEALDGEEQPRRIDALHRLQAGLSAAGERTHEERAAGNCPGGLPR
jgi:hypothetical protein